MAKSSELITSIVEELKLSLEHLQYSYNKVSNVQKLAPDPRLLDVEQLETWESFVARFARVSDIFLSKYLRLVVLKEDPAFRGTFRDFLDAGEKIGLIDNADIWMNLRELRNKTAHEYTRDELKNVFEQVLKHTPFLLSEIKKVLK
jgi:hypothetical protein